MWTKVRDRMPPVGEEVWVYDGFWTGLSKAEWNGEEWVGEFTGPPLVTHWTKGDPDEYINPIELLEEAQEVAAS